MKIIKNENLIKRNGRIGQWTSIGALVVLGGGMYISFQKPELFGYAVTSLFVGFMLTQVGMYFGNRFGRSPRPDEKLDAGLKGLSGEFTIYHYTTPASHLLVGPAGIWALLPYQQRGTVTYHKNRWRLSGGGFLQTYMRVFGQEGLGRPDAEADSEVRALQKEFNKHFEENQTPPIQAALIFTNDDVTIDADDTPMPAIKLKQLKEFMRKGGKERSISSEKLQQINSFLAED